MPKITKLCLNLPQLCLETLWLLFSGHGVVSGNIRCMQIFAGVPLGGGRQMTVGLSMTAIFGFFGNVRDKASNIT